MNTIPLSEISRPKTLDAIVGQDAAVARFKEYLRDPDATPHMILSGPPGCGKTSAILAWASQVYGSKVTVGYQGGNVGNSRPVRMLNMSALRSVKDVLHRVHDTCQYIHDTSGLRTSRGIVICDEADSLTAESQEVLVYCLRKYHSRWIFALVMNYPSRIGKRLWEECEHIPFTPLANILPIVSTTLKNAKLSRRVTKRGMSVLTDVYDGDLRRVLNSAQGVLHCGEGFVPEWKRWNDIPFREKTPVGVYKYLRDICESEGSTDENRMYLGLALGLHRPGSLRPLIYAIQEYRD